jgi:hypothetical protein
MTGFKCAKCNGAITHSCTEQDPTHVSSNGKTPDSKPDNGGSTPPACDSPKPFRAWVAVDPKGRPDLRTMSIEHRYCLNHWKMHYTRSYLLPEQIGAASYPERFDLPNYAWELAQRDGWRVLPVTVTFDEEGEG